MKKIPLFFAVAALAFAFLTSEIDGRGRGGGGFGGGGGFARPAGGGAIGSYGGGIATRSSTPIVGARGGTGQIGAGSGSYTTQRGGTIDYRGAGVGGTTAGGVTGGRYVGGVQVNTAGGRDITRVGTGAGAVGPGGNAIAGRSGATVGSGPAGAFGTRYQGGVAIGPHGAAAGGTRFGAAAGPGGVMAGGTRFGAAAGPGSVVAGGTRGAAAVGPYGAVAGRTTVAASGARGTYYRSTAAVRTQGTYVRGAVRTYPCFRPAWYRQYPGAWFAAGWVSSSVWRAASWASCATYCGYAEEPIYYDYGSTVVYENDTVIVNGEPAASAEDYAKQAVTLADNGRTAKASQDDEWLPLGVFAMVQGDEKTSNHIFQLAVNKQGVLRGNYYDAVTDSTSQIYGSVDKKTQRAAWTVGDRKTPTYEVGIANLTKDETTMMVHYGTERSVQYTFVRVEDPDQKKD